MTRFLGRLTRNADAPLLLESFLVAGVVSFLGIRWFLAAAGYPRLGSHGIHIAHMLWGGLLMLVALMCLFAFLDRTVHRAAAVIAGLGFGTFIDEIGKFVTSDNDYFYRPAIALVYVTFVVAFLLGRTLIRRQRPLSGDEALANALDLLAVKQHGPMDPADRAEIWRLIAVADPDAPRTRLVREYLASLPEGREPRSRARTLQQRLAAGYERVMANPWADRALTVGVVAYAALAVGLVLVAVPSQYSGTQTATIATAMQDASTLAGAACVLIGVTQLHRSRAAAFHWFLRGLLVWILVTQMFVFYSSQLAGLGGLVVDLGAYGGLTFALNHEVLSGSR